MGKDQTTTQMQVSRADPTTLAREGVLWDRASELAGQPYQAYGGQRIADFTPDQLAGFEAARAAAGAGAGTVANGIDLTQQAGAYNPMLVGAQQAGPAATADPTGIMAFFNAQRQGAPAAGARDVSASRAIDMGLSDYLNPWTDQVVNAGLSDLDRQRQMAIAQGQGAAAKAGAYGGSRHGVADSLTNAEAMRAAGSLSANTRAAGFNTALQALTGDANRQLSAAQGNQAADVATSVANAGNATSLTGSMLGNLANLGMFNAGQVNNMGQFNASLAQNADVANQGAGLTANAQRLAAGGQLGSLGAQEQQMGLIGADALTRIGGMQQGLNQAKNDVRYDEWLRRQADPYNKLMFQQGFVGTPGFDSFGKTTQEGSTLGGLAGAAATIAGGPVGGAIANMFSRTPTPEFNPNTGIFGNGGMLG